MAEIIYCKYKICDVCPNLDSRTNFCPFDEEKVLERQKQIAAQFTNKVFDYEKLPIMPFPTKRTWLEALPERRKDDCL